MDRRTHALILVSLLLLLAPACFAGDAAVEASQLAGPEWILVAYRKSRPIEGTEITATFDDGQVSGSGGCNHYFGSYDVQGRAIQIGPLAWTEMACMEPEGVMEQEAAVLQYLADAETFRVDGDRLFVYWNDHEALTFEPKS